MVKLAVKAATDGAAVLYSLNTIVAWAREDRSRLGYFAALYRRVTLRLQKELAAGKFNDPAYMENLEVIFANRYFDALTSYLDSLPCRGCWVVSFEASGHRLPLVIEQLCAAMNAHINFDLGIATAEAAAPRPLAPFLADFNLMNDLLVDEVGGVARALAEISPVIGLLEKLGLRTETKIVDYCMVEARSLAWERALKLSAATPEQAACLITELDLEAGIVGKLIVDPIPPTSLLLEPIRIFECNDIDRVLDVLAA